MKLSNDSGGDEMGVFFNDDVLRLAIERIRSEEPNELIELSFGKEDSVIAVSRNSNDLISLRELSHNGVTYYLGLPK